MVMGVVCGMVEMSIDLTLILAAVKTVQFSVFLLISIGPPKSWAIELNISVFQQSNGSPLIEIHPLKATTEVSMMLTVLEYLLRKIEDVPILMEVIEVTLSASALLLQKNRTRSALKSIR